MTGESLKDILIKHIPQDDRPVVCYTGIWTLASAYDIPRDELAPKILSEITSVVGSKRTLLMPTYTQRPQKGFLNLDTTPGMTGLVNEALRMSAGALRTASAFFSFAATGPDATRLNEMRPIDAWGDDSVFEYIHKTNAHLCMIGVPIQMCSFLHRVEWLAKVPYRYTKEFETNIILDGEPERLKERLYVRSLDPVAENIWPGVREILLETGMHSSKLGRGEVLTINAQTLIDTLLPRIQADPFSFLKNPEEFKRGLQTRNA